MPRKSAPASPDVTPLLRAAFARHQTGDLQGAKSGYDTALTKAPDDAEALYLSGALDHQMGDHTAALRKLERSLAVRPGHGPALEMLGAVAAQAGQFERAAESFGAAAAINPKSPDLFYNQGVMLFRAARYDAAATALRKATALAPQHAQALYLLANVLRLQSEWQAAADVYSRAIALQPANANALDEYGGVLAELGRRDDAIRVIEQAIAAAPDAANPYTNLGRLYQDDIAQAHKALALHDQAIARAPDHSDAHNNRGVALQLLGRHDDALAAYERAITLKPDHAAAHRSKGLVSLMLGRWADGWRENEWRAKCHDAAFSTRHFPQPAWNGEAPRGTLLIWGEHGIGDEILYGSMASDLIARGYPLLWDMDARLRPLVARAYPDVPTVTRRTPPDLTVDIAAQISTASLGQYLRADAASFPSAPHRYLRADDKRAADYRVRLTASGATRVIGVSWLSTNERFGAHKSNALKAWQPLWDSAGSKTCFVDLQYGDTAAERAASGLSLAHLDDLDLFHDIDGLAALITACDHVITVSNTTAHLAGALNIPTAVLVPTGNGQLWYWGNAGDRTPWYPSVKIFRQSEPGRWDDVLAAVARELAAP